MNRILPTKAFLALCLLTAALVGSQELFGQVNLACARMNTGQLSNLNGFIPFQGTNSLWNTDISSAQVDSNSDNIINSIGPSTTLHPDFGSGLYDGSSIGIPYQVVSGAQAKVSILFGAYADESDPGPMPIPANALIEGYPNPDDGDRHVLVLEKDGCWLYELYHAYPTPFLSWRADSSAVWDMTMANTRPYTWTSADAAGLPIFPGLVRYDEVAAGAIKHAVRFTVPNTQEAFVLPATHWASNKIDPSLPPMGTRLRLKANFDISHFSAHNQVILTALKKYGMILADNGSGVYISGAPDSRWDNDDLGALKSISASNFEVIAQGVVYTPNNVPTGPNPSIKSFTANPNNVHKGNPVTLSWSVTGAEYNIISPVIGPVRGTSITFTPTQTATYTLYSTNQYGRSTAMVTVTVQ
ncbi:MAG: hypothetical protein WAM71_10085 [Candidatus Korobacteraceae bacterium]